MQCLCFAERHWWLTQQCSSSRQSCLLGHLGMGCRCSLYFLLWCWSTCQQSRACTLCFQPLCCSRHKFQLGIKCMSSGQGLCYMYQQPHPGMHHLFHTNGIHLPEGGNKTLLVHLEPLLCLLDRLCRLQCCVHPHHNNQMGTLHMVGN